MYTSNFSDTELASSFLFCGVETYDERFSIDLGAMFRAVVVDRYEDIYIYIYIKIIKSIKVTEEFVQTIRPNIFLYKKEARLTPVQLNGLFKRHEVGETRRT